MSKRTKFTDRLWVIFAFILFSLFVYKMGKRALTDYFVDENAIHMKAIIINEQNAPGNQRVQPEFTYSYQFIIDGKEYKENSHDKTLNIGDTVEILYNKRFPVFNKPLHSND